ncbi:uncharacterized protein LOC100185625 [Ciona intestinalis]
MSITSHTNDIDGEEKESINLLSVSENGSKENNNEHMAAHRRKGSSPSLRISRNSSHGRSLQRKSQTNTHSPSRNRDTDSIGSAGSIMFNIRTPSGGSKYTSPSIASVDVNDEILVGDEREFHDACKSGDIDEVRRFIKSGIDINCRNKHDRVPMHWAAGNGHLDVVKELLDDGAMMDAADKFGMDTLLWGAWFGHAACVRHMMHAGAKFTTKNKHGYTWLHCAVQNNHMSVVNILTEEMQDFDKDIQDESGKTGLHVACKYGRHEIAQRLLELNCKGKIKDNAGNLPLHIAAKHGFYKVIAPLYEADNSLDDTNSDHKTALHLASEAGHSVFCLELLKFDVDVNAETEDEVCPLHLAVINGHPDVATVLIEHNADIDAGNKHNQTPLHFAVTGSNSELTRILVKAGANASVQDARNETSLHLAAENGLGEITELLLLAHSNHNLMDQKGKTPLDVAARGNYVNIVDMIIKAERYYYWRMAMQANNSVVPSGNLSFKPDNHSSTQHLRSLLYRLATKYLKSIEWKQLAFFWGFTDKQLLAIEEQYTGNKSYKEHGHRMLLIWLHGCQISGQNPIKGLYEGLVGIQKIELAETMRAKAAQTEDEKGCSIS